MQIPVVQAVNIDLIDLGTYPLKFGGVKAYETVAEEGMLEVPVQWGSNARVRVSARLGFGGYCVDIPVEVRDIQVCWSAFSPAWSIIGPRVQHACDSSCSFVVNHSKLHSEKAFLSTTAPT